MSPIGTRLGGLPGRLLEQNAERPSRFAMPQDPLLRWTVATKCITHYLDVPLSALRESAQASRGGSRRRHAAAEGKLAVSALLLF